jgi:chaperonin cofactor prefoldin
MTKDDLKYKTLENSEMYSDIGNCFYPTELDRNPELITKLNKQSGCFDKYGIAGELRTKLVDTNKSLEKLNFYKKITEITLNKALEIDNAIKSNALTEDNKLYFFVIPKGQLVETKIQKEIGHKPQCKIDSLDSSKIPVQSCEIKEIAFSVFVENTKDQINRLKSGLADFQKIIGESKNGEFGMIATISLILKASTLANDLTLSGTDNFELVDTELSSINNTATFIEITILDNGHISNRNPSGKVLNISIKYPQLDADLNFIGQKNMDLPPVYLETFEKDIFPKVLDELRERIAEYDNIISDFSKNQRNLSTTLSTMEKNLSCYNNTDSNKSIPTKNVIQELDIDQDMNPFEKQTFVSFINDVWNKTKSGVKATFLSISLNLAQKI